MFNENLKREFLNEFLNCASAIGEQFLQTYDNDIEIVCQMIRNCSLADFLFGHAIKAIVLFSLFRGSFIFDGISRNWRYLFIRN